MYDAYPDTLKWKFVLITLFSLLTFSFAAWSLSTEIKKKRKITNIMEIDVVDEIVIN